MKDYLKKSTSINLWTGLYKKIHMIFSASLHFRAVALADLSPADLPTLVMFVNQAYRGDFSKQGWTTEADLLGGQRLDEEMLRDDLSQTNTRLLLMYSDSKLVGCVYLCGTDVVPRQLKAEGSGMRAQKGAQSPNPRAYLGMLTLHPANQGKGLGSRLLAEAESFVTREWIAHQMEMTVITQRPELIAWYERRGYSLTGEKRPFPKNDPRYGLPKRDDLEFSVLVKDLA